MKIKNAKELPQILYGLHMVAGVAEYADTPDGTPYRILIEEQCCKDMDPSFAGKPLYVRHVEDVNLDKLQEEAAGYVVESFYNPMDGKHWAKFVVVSDSGHEAVRSGWKLSNAYFPKEFTGGGLWHNVEYQKQVVRAEYEHLALVPNPRYEESIILTPDEFKTYNEQKSLELKKLANEKEKRPMFNFFKKTKLENSAAADLESTVVTLASGTEKSIKQLINEAEEHEKKMADDSKHSDDEGKKYADMGHMVKLHDGSEMSVEELVKKHKELSESKHDDDSKKSDDEGKKKADDADMSDEEAKKKALELAEHEKEEIAGKKESDDSDGEEEDEGAAEKAAEAAAGKKKNDGKSQKHFDALANAAEAHGSEVIETSDDQIRRGVARYGSGK